MSLLMTALAALSTAAPAQASTPILYTPVKPASEQGIVVKGWGSGTGAETDEAAYEGVHSIRVSTRNFFQGAFISYATPISLGDQFGDRNNLLKLVLKTADAGGAGSGSGMPGMGAPGKGGAGMPGMGGPGRGPGGGSGMPGMGGPGRGGGAGMPGGAGRGGSQGGSMGSGMGGPGMGGPGMGGPGQGPGRGGGMGPGGMGAPGGPGGMGGMGGGTSDTTSLKTVRVIVTTTDGKKSEAYMPISTSGAGERGWRTVAIPLQAIAGFERTNKTIKEIAFAGDVTTTFYVGDIRVVNDPTPIRADILGRRTYNLALGDKVTFQGGGQGGSSVLEYVWDFDSTDGLQEDAIGQTITHQFRKDSQDLAGGKYTVTLTVRDKFGLKKPATATVEVVVNP